MRSSVYISAERLAAELRWNAAPLVLDVRWSLAEPDGLPAYAAGHIAGARYVDLEVELSGIRGEGTGRHPLPDIRDLQEAARSWGMNNGMSVVVYDDVDGAAAARAWWVLRWAGVSNVRILDGGYRAWAGHGKTETGTPPPLRRKQRGNVTLEAGHMPTLSARGVETFQGLLLDARAPVRYRGEYEPLDPRAGHIPGAVNAPHSSNVDARGMLLAETTLRERYEGLGVPMAGEQPAVGVYCGSGVTAAHDVAVLASLGVQAALYPGSWSQWVSDPTRPVEVGA